MNTRPVASRRASSIVWPTTTNSIGRPAFGGVAGAGQQDVVALVQADRAQHAHRGSARRGRIGGGGIGRGVVLMRHHDGAKPGKCRRMRAAASSDGATTRSRVGQEAGGPLAQRRGADSLLVQRTMVGDTGLAARQRRFAAIASLAADQRNARAEPGVVMHVHAVRHAQPRQSARGSAGGWPSRWCTSIRCGRSACSRSAQSGHFLRQPIAQIGKVVGRRRRRPAPPRAPSGSCTGRNTMARRPAARCVSTAAAICRSTPPPSSCVTRMAACRGPPAALPPTQQIQPAPRFGQRIPGLEVLHQRGVAGMQPFSSASLRACRWRPAGPNDPPPAWPTNSPGTATWRQPRWRARRQKSFSSP